MLGNQFVALNEQTSSYDQARMLKTETRMLLQRFATILYFRYPSVRISNDLGQEAAYVDSLPR